MERTIDDTMEYVALLTRHVHKGDIPAAILAVLADLEFQTHKVGFPFLRKSIYLKTVDSDMNLDEICQEILRICDSARGVRQINQAIHNLIIETWKYRNRAKWDMFVSERDVEKDYPSNFAFIARMACFMELWCSWCKEVVSCAGE